MDIQVYMHRTKKKNFEVVDKFTVTVDLEKLPEDKIDDLDFINLGFSNDCQRIARTRDCVKKYGTAYLSFIRPQYEGDEKDNNFNGIYFDNKEMLFMKKAPKKRTRKKKEEVTNESEEGQA